MLLLFRAEFLVFFPEILSSLMVSLSQNPVCCSVRVIEVSAQHKIVVVAVKPLAIRFGTIALLVRPGISIHFF